MLNNQCIFNALRDSLIYMSQPPQIYQTVQLRRNIRAAISEVAPASAQIPFFKERRDYGSEVLSLPRDELPQRKKKEKTMERLNSPIIFLFALAAFIAMCIWAWPKTEITPAGNPQGQTQQERQKFGEFIDKQLREYPAAKEQHRRDQSVELFGADENAKQ